MLVGMMATGKSTVVSTGLFNVASGFIATRAATSSPVEIPPSTPPASVDART